MIEHLACDEKDETCRRLGVVVMRVTAKNFLIVSPLESDCCTCGPEKAQGLEFVIRMPEVGTRVR